MTSALRQAVRWQMLSVSPASGVSPPRVERAELRIPTAAEMRVLLDAAAQTPYELPVLLAATSGMRRGELLELRWSDVDLDAGTASVRRGKTGTSRRTIHLPASTVAPLRARHKEQASRRLLCGPAWQDEDIVCDRGDGGPVNADSLSHAFSEIADSVGLDEVRLHDLRHAFATTLLAAGVNVKVVSEALGHASTAFTMDVYAHVLPGMGEQVARAIEEALGE
jgi:integrase